MGNMPTVMYVYHCIWTLYLAPEWKCNYTGEITQMNKDACSSLVKAALCEDYHIHMLYAVWP